MYVQSSLQLASHLKYHTVNQQPMCSLIFTRKQSPDPLKTNHTLPCPWKVTHFGLLLFLCLITCYIFVRFEGGSSRDRSGFPLESKSALAMSLRPCKLENSGPPCSSLSSWEPGIESDGVLLRLPKIQTRLMLECHQWSNRDCTGGRPV